MADRKKDSTKERVSLLLYLETRAVDHGGAVAGDHMNADDFKDAEAMADEGLIEFGRITVASIQRRNVRQKICAHWVRLSVMAFDIVSDERRARAARGWETRSYRTTAEKRSEGSRVSSVLGEHDRD